MPCRIPLCALLAFAITATASCGLSGDTSIDLLPPNTLTDSGGEDASLPDSQGAGAAGGGEAAANLCIHRVCEEPTPFCDPGVGACVGCRNANDCDDSAPYCEPDSKQCVECLKDANCQNGHCDASKFACD